jgi:hypothetical protein
MGKLSFDAFKQPPQDWMRAVAQAAEGYEGMDDFDASDLAYSLYSLGVINSGMSVREAAGIVAQHAVQQ